MKKHFSLLLLLLPTFLPLCSLAQIGTQLRDLSVGITGGAALSSVSFDPTVKQGQHVAPAFGLAMRYTSEKYFNTYCALQVELNYVQMGWKENVLDIHGNELPDTYQRDLTYIQLPMFAHLSWGRYERGVMFYINLGPQVGFCISEGDKRSATFTLNEEGVPDRPNNLYGQYDMSLKHKFDYGIAGGAGVELNTKIGHIDLEGRYYYGLSDIFGNSKKDLFSRSSNQNIEIRLAYLLPIKTR